MNNLQRLLKCYKPILGMVHISATPGSPKYTKSVSSIIQDGIDSAKLLIECGFDGIVLENMNDVPYESGNQINPIVQNILSIIGWEIKRKYPDVIMGIQILSCGNKQALSVAVAAKMDFVRCEGFVFGHLGDEGWVESCASDLLRYRSSILSNQTNLVWIVADIKKKHASHAVTSDLSIKQTACAAEMFLTDAVVVTGDATGSPPSINDIKECSEGLKNCPILLGSGIDLMNLEEFLKSEAKGLIIGSSLKEGGKDWKNKLDKLRVKEFVLKANEIRCKK